jgi:hypothetical protein
VTPEELALRRIREEQQRRGTFRMEFDPDTKKFLGVRVVGSLRSHMTDPDEIMPWSRARQLFDETQYRTHEIFQVGKPQPGSGRYNYPAIEGFSRLWDRYVKREYGANAIASVTREGYGFETESAADALLSAFQRGARDDPSSYFGIPVIDQTVAMRLSFGRQVGGKVTESTFDESMRFLGQEAGMFALGGEKIMKRMKPLLTMRGLGTLETGLQGTTSFKVGMIHDQTREKLRAVLAQEGLSGKALDQKVEELADIAWDGTAIVKRSVMMNQLQQMEDEAKKQLEMLKGVEGPEALEARRNLTATLQKIGARNKVGSLRWQVANDRVFGNARIMGLNVVDLDSGQSLTWADMGADHAAKAGRVGFDPTDLVQGQIRGDVRSLSDQIVNLLTGRKDIDIIAGREAVAPEVGFAATAKQAEQLAALYERQGLGKQQFGYGVARMLTLEEHKAHDVYTDVQSLSSMPFFFDRGRLISTAEDDFAKFLEGGGDFATAQGGLLRMADEMMGRLTDPNIVPTDPAELFRVQQSMGYVQRFRRAVEGGIDPRERGDIMSGMVMSYRRHLTAKAKDGVLTPRFRVPDARAAGVVMSGQLGWDVPQDKIAYNPKIGSWVFHERSWGELKDYFGGADLDDTLVNMLRMDEEGNLKALLYRQPNALNEFAIMNVDPGDAFVHKVLRSKGYDDFGVYDQARKVFEGWRKELPKISGEIDEINAVMRSRGGDVQKLRERAEKVRQNIIRLTTGNDGAIRQKDIANARRKLQGLQGRIERTEADIDALERMQGLAIERRTSALAKQSEAHAAMKNYVSVTHKADLEPVKMKDFMNKQVLMRKRGAVAPGESAYETVPIMQGLFETRRQAIERIAPLPRLPGETDAAYAARDAARQLKADQIIVGRDPRVSLMKIDKAAEGFAFRPVEIAQQIGNFVKNRGALGRYSNFRMTIDSWLNGLDLSKADYEKIQALTDAHDGLRFYGSYNLVEHEKAIDMAIRANQMRISFVDDPDSPQYMTQDLMEELFGRKLEERQLARNVTGDVVGARLSLDEAREMNVRQMMNDLAIMREALDDDRFQGLGQKMVEQRLARSDSMGIANEVLQSMRDRYGFTVDMTKIQGTSLYDEIAQAHKDTLTGQWGAGLFDEVTGKLNPDQRLAGRALERIKEIGFPKEMLEHPAATAYERSGHEMMQVFFESLEKHKLTPNALKVDEPLEGALDDLSGKVDWHGVQADLMESLLPHFEEAALGPVAGGKQLVAGEEVYKRMLGLASAIHKTNRGYMIPALSGASPSFAEMFDRAHAWSIVNNPTERHVVQETVAGLFGGQGPISQARRMLEAAPITEEQARKTIAATRSMGLTAGEGASHIGKMAEMLTRPFRQAGEFFERVSPAHLRELDTKMTRYGLAGIGVLSAFGVLKAVRDRDHTSEDMAGPQHLPGGSAYMGPMGGGIDFQAAQYNYPDRGVTFEVRGRGKMDHGKFLQQAKFLTGAHTTRASFHDSPTLESPDQQRRRILSGFR